MQETQQAINRRFDHFEYLFQEFQEATPLTKGEKLNKLISQVDVLSLSEEGMAYLFQKVMELESAGVFADSAWAEPNRLQPLFVKGTLKGGHPTSSLELLSELRMLTYAKGEAQSEAVTADEAAAFLEEVVAHNLEFVFNTPTEETRATMSEHELAKATRLFRFLMAEMPLEGIKEKLVEEIHLLLEQRPVVTRHAHDLIHLVSEKMTLDLSQEADQQLRKYIDALKSPSEGTQKYPTAEWYQDFLDRADHATLEREALEMGTHMREYGLVSRYHAQLLLHLVHEHRDEILPIALQLSLAGQGGLQQNPKFVRKLIKSVVHTHNADAIHGLAKMLEIGLLTRQPIRSGLDNLLRIHLNPKVERRILKSIAQPHPEVTALQYLVGSLMKILGQPLGIGQGNNPTCQSARGISMWSQHAPAKLINLVITAATQNNLIMRFEGQNLESSMLGKGLVTTLDYNLDAVSVVLVPHLDKLYNEMMRLASGRFEDPHKWVNPAMYGEWIQVGFASVYDYTTNTIRDFDGFMRRFYAAFHPDYNGNQRMVYPNPIGIFITSSRGDMLGFHAVSLLRVTRNKQGQVRAYFLNPNNEGRQDWGQGIRPTVFGHGEKHGESSLPFEHLAARLYAFHYNHLEVPPRLPQVPASVVLQVKDLAQQSWGKSYTWNETVRLW